MYNTIGFNGPLTRPEFKTIPGPANSVAQFQKLLFGNATPAQLTREQLTVKQAELENTLQTARFANPAARAYHEKQLALVKSLSENFNQLLTVRTATGVQPPDGSPPPRQYLIPEDIAFVAQLAGKEKRVEPSDFTALRKIPPPQSAPPNNNMSQQTQLTPRQEWDNQMSGLTSNLQYLQEQLRLKPNQSSYYQPLIEQVLQDIEAFKANNPEPPLDNPEV